MMRRILFLLIALLSWACLSSGDSPFDLKQREAYTFLNEANRLLENNRLADADIQYGRACESFALIDDMEGIVLCKTNRAIVSLQRGRLDAAENLFAEALELCDAFDYAGMRGRILVHLTLLYINRGEQNRARKFVNRALENLEDPEDRRRALAYRGYLDLEQGQLDAAEKAFEEALKTGRTDLRSYIMINLARLHRKKNELEKALKYARGAAEIDRLRAQPSHLAYDYAVLSDIFAAQLDYKEAVLHRKRALSLNLVLNNYNNARADARALYDHYRLLKDTEGQREMGRLLATLANRR